MIVFQSNKAPDGGIPLDMSDFMPLGDGRRDLKTLFFDARLLPYMGDRQRGVWFTISPDARQDFLWDSLTWYGPGYAKLFPEVVAAKVQNHIDLKEEENNETATQA